MYPRSSICGGCWNLSVLSEDCLSEVPLVSARLEIRSTNFYPGGLPIDISHKADPPSIGSGPYWVRCICRYVIGCFLIAFFPSILQMCPIFTNRWCLKCFLCKSETAKVSFCDPPGKRKEQHRAPLRALFTCIIAALHIYVTICTAQADLNKKVLVLTDEHQVCSCPKINSRWEFGREFIIHVGRRQTQEKEKQKFRWFIDSK